MALQMRYTAKFLTVFPSAYFRVVKLDLDYRNKRAMVEVWVYPDDATRQSNDLATVERFVLQVADTADATPFTQFFGNTAQNALDMNPQKAVYQYLKTLGSYSSSVDV